MSRIGKAPIAVPAGVTIDINNANLVTVKGPLGQLEQQFNKDMKIAVVDGVATVTRPSDNKTHRELHGLTRALLNNMVLGVSKGYEKKLKLVGVGYRAAKSGKKLELSLGYSHPVIMDEPAGLTIEVPSPTDIIVKGIDKQQVGDFAADIRAWRKPEPYKGKGIRYEDEYVRRKEGKTGKK